MQKEKIEIFYHTEKLCIIKRNGYIFKCHANDIQTLLQKNFGKKIIEKKRGNDFVIEFEKIIIVFKNSRKIQNDAFYITEQMNYEENTTFLKK